MSDEKVISAALKCYYKNKANEYPCPDCGRMVNKTKVHRHNKSMFHVQAARIKTLEAQVGKIASAQPPADTKKES